LIIIQDLNTRHKAAHDSPYVLSPTTITCSRRGPWAPGISVCSMSAERDGPAESCGVRADGITSFSLIQNASDTRNGEALVIFQFDLLHVDEEDPSALPLVERKAS